MQLASKCLLDKIVICHCTENHIFFFRTSWKDSLPKKIALEYDLSCIIKKDDISFFPKIWSYRLDGKWKMIFLKKCTEIWYFLQTFWEYGLSKKCRTGTWSFLYYLERWYFSPENMIFFSWAENERRPFSGNTWKHDASPSEKKTGNLTYRVEVWPLLKFIRLEIFHNE